MNLLFSHTNMKTTTVENPLYPLYSLDKWDDFVASRYSR